MKLRTKTNLLGLFVFLSLMIIIGFLVALSVRETLESERTYVMRFTGNLKGLHVGTPVEYRGIKIGQVYKISLQIDPKSTLPIMPVWIRFQKGLIKQEDYTARLHYLIKLGLRGQLQTSNILTGDQVIALIFKPKTKIVLHYPGKLEIPTIPAITREALIEQTLETAQRTLNTITQFFQSDRLNNAVSATDKAFTQTAETMKTADKTFATATTTLQTAKQSFAYVNQHINPISVQLIEALSSFQKAAHHISVLSEYLSRHPESIIIGKRKS